MLTETAQLIGGHATLTTVCDITDADAVQEMTSATVEKFGRIDVVVNKAGISRTAPIAEVSIQQWREVMAADVESIILVTQAALPSLLERGGSIVNVASVAGLGGDYAMTSYNLQRGQGCSRQPDPLTRRRASRPRGAGQRRRPFPDHDRRCRRHPGH